MLYTLPTITVADAYSAVDEKTVKVFKVDGETLTEKTLVEEGGNYTFTPTEVGTYRIQVYAKDAAGNDVTKTQDFIVSGLAEGEVFDPASLTAPNQLTNSQADTDVVFVSADENADETYGGAYWLITPPADNAWNNTTVKPRLDLSAYDEYDVITFWVYAESKNGGTFNLSILADTELQAFGIESNAWQRVEIPASKFVEKVNETWLFAIKYAKNGIYAARIGEVMARKKAQFTISEPTVGAIEGSTPATVTFTVGGTPSERNVKVTKADGTELNGLTHTGDEYSIAVSEVGDYTITVTPVSEVYIGSQTKTFTVRNKNRIEVNGEYASPIPAGTEIDILPAQVIDGETPTQDTVTVKLYQKENDAWTDISSAIVADKFTPETKGDYKVEYSFDGLASVEKEFAVCGAGEVFDPAYAGARDQLENSKAGTAVAFVSADDNSDATYGGAYWRITPSGSGWNNTTLTPRLEDLSAYASYDVIAFWVYAESEKDGIFYLSVLADTALIQNAIPCNTWLRIEIPRDKFVEKVNATWLFAINYNTVDRGEVHTLRIGEGTARKTANYTISDPAVGTIENGAPATVTFTVTGTPAFTVKVTKADGTEVSGLTHTGNDYSIDIAEVGEYTITVSPESELYIGSASKTFTVRNDNVIEVSGEYASPVPVGDALTILSAQVMNGSTPTADVVTTKVFKKTGSDWTDVTASVQGDQYTPDTVGDYKVVYSFGYLDPVEKTFTARNKGEVFDPVFGQDTQIGIGGGAFGGTEKTVVSAEENTDETYGGAYVQYSVPVAGWGNVGITPTFARAHYAAFDYVSIWVYVEQAAGNADEVITFAVGNSSLYRRYIKTGAWTQIQLAKCIDGMTGNLADNVFFENAKFGNSTSTVTFDLNMFLAAKYTKVGQNVRIGAITAGNFTDEDDRTMTMFDPTAANIADNVYSAYGTTATSGVVNPVSDGDYSGACVSWTTGASGWQNVYLTPTAGSLDTLSTYSRVKIWLYIKTTSGTSAPFEFLMYNDTNARQKVMTDTWVEWTIDIGLYLNYIQQKPQASTSSGNPYFMSQNTWAGATVYIGTATAIAYV